MIPLLGAYITLHASAGPGARSSKAPETFRALKARAKSRTLRLQSCFIHIFSIWTEVPFIQEVSGEYTSPCLGADELKWLYGPVKFPGLSRNGPPVQYWEYQNGQHISCYGPLIDSIGKWQINWLLWLNVFLLNCFSGSTKMCDWLSNLHYATDWPRAIQKELLITAHCFAVVFARVSRHLSWGVRRILSGQTARVSSLSVSLPQEDDVEKVKAERSSMSLDLCTSIFSIISETLVINWSRWHTKLSRILWKRDS